MSEIILEISNISKTFNRRIKAVQNLNLKVATGSIVGFLGNNGAGKTTTIRMILGLMKPDQGDICIKKRSIKKERLKILENVGALVEGPAFYEYLSARDNLRIFADYSGKIPGTRINEVLETVDLARRANDKVRTYSMGMKQRLGIAQALLNKPELLILDEPTNGLDPYGVQEVRALIKKLNRTNNVTIFLSSHILPEVEQICDTVAVIKDGRLITTGRVDELLNPDDKYYEIAGPDNSQLLQLLKEIDDVSILEEEKIHETGVIRLHLGKHEPESFLGVLVKANARIRLFAPGKITLEELFFRIVGGA